MQLIIDELNGQIEKMGADAKRRENGLLSMLEELKTEIGLKI